MNNPGEGNRIYILTGKVHSGKTTFVKKTVKELKEKGIAVEGFLSERMTGDEKGQGYDLIDLSREKPVPFIRTSGQPEWPQIGPYFFDPRGLAEAQKIIRGSRRADLLVVDEVGPLELGGRGLWPALEGELFRPSKKILLVIRESLLKDFLSILNQSEVKIFKRTDGRMIPCLLDELHRRGH
ncbi:MAG: nucleoside-triphosphatase [Candidatus Aminicenantales bacterium]